MNDFLKPEYNPEYDPVSFYNKYKSEHAFDLFQNIIKDVKLEKINEQEYSDSDAKYIIKPGILSCETINSRKLTPGLIYTPFMILTKYKFKGNHFAAYTWVNATFLNAHIPYIRVGVAYFKKISKPDRYSIDRIELKRWTKEEIKEDHGAAILKNVTKYDDFIIEPDNKDYQPVISSMHNLYYEFSHKPKKGELLWTKRMIEHVFGEGIEYDKGIKYMQILYLYPKQVLPILVLASKERSTGKTTFLDWMSLLFGGNMVVVNPSDIVSQFNSSYATANIIGIEETVTDKSSTVEKLKALSTTKFINLNQKFIDNSKIPFFAKLIITTNDEGKFLRIESEEIRFWVRKLTKPKFHNTKIDEELIKEIPAFLYYLESLPIPDFTKSRMVFTPEELSNESLTLVKEESKPELYKDLKEKITYWFGENKGMTEFFAHPVDIHNRWYDRKNNISAPYIRSILKKHFNMKPGDPIYYFPFNVGNGNTQRCYKFERKDFIEYDEPVNEAPEPEIMPETKEKQGELFDVSDKHYGDDLPF